MGKKFIEMNKTSFFRRERETEAWLIPKAGREVTCRESRGNGKIHREGKRSMGKRVVPWKRERALRKRTEKNSQRRKERAVHEEGKEQLTKDGRATWRDRIVHQPSCKGWTDVLEGKRRWEDNIAKRCVGDRAQCWVKEEDGRLSWKRRSSIPVRLYRTVEEIVWYHGDRSHPSTSSSYGLKDTTDRGSMCFRSRSNWSDGVSHSTVRCGHWCCDEKYRVPWCLLGQALRRLTPRCFCGLHMRWWQRESMIRTETRRRQGPSNVGV